MLTHLKQGISIVQENSTSAFASLADAAGKNFKAYMHQPVELLFLFFQDQKYKGKEYVQLRGQVLEALSMIFNSVGSENFQFASERFIELMIEVQKPECRENGVDYIYIFSAWQRVQLIVPDLITAHLDRIMPNLLLLAEHSVKEDIAEEEEKLKKVDDDEES
jgi:hypothetical protein